MGRDHELRFDTPRRSIFGRCLYDSEREECDGLEWSVSGYVHCVLYLAGRVWTDRILRSVLHIHLRIRGRADKREVSYVRPDFFNYRHNNVSGGN